MTKKIIVILLTAGLLAGLSGCSVQPANSQESALETPQETVVEEDPQPTKIAEQYHWDMSPIYADTNAFSQALKKVEQELIPTLSAYKGNLSTEENVLAFMKQKDVVDQELRKLDVYTTLLTEQNQQDNTATSLSQQAQKARDLYREATAFYGPELLANSNEFLDGLLENKEIEPYANQITRLRENAEHILQNESEILLLPLSNAANGASTLFSKLVFADMAFPSIKDPNGNDVVIDESNWLLIVMSNSDREFRKESTETLLNTFGQYRNTLAQNMDNFIQSTVSLARSHRYATAKEASMSVYTAPPAVYDNLISAANSNLDSAYRYVALRKKLLGTDEFYSSDMLYPLVEELEVSIPYEKTEDLLMKALAPLGEEYQANLQKAFDEQWIDVYPAEGKSNGAFSIGLYGVHPYVMMNYTDDYNSLSTLAHELGHAMHQYESAQNQKSDFNSDPTSFTSEVASTTNELLLADYMIKNAKSDKEKLYYLFSELTTLHGTFFTQAMFSEFEDAMYKIVEDGGSLNADALEKLWTQTVQKYYGPECLLTDGSQFGWSRIPHFYYNYYVYQYATSIAAACTISERIVDGEEGATNDYLAFLKSGDSDDGAALLQIAGVDITSATLADALVKRYNNLIDQIEELEKTM